MMRFPVGRNNPIRLIYKNLLRYTQSVKSNLDTNVTIDILIPVVEKDFFLLQFVIDSARNNIVNPINNIFIVARDGPIRDFCKQNNCIFLDEDIVMPVKKSSIIYNGVEWHRAGWIFQQLIKLNADELTQSENILILDADTCLVSKQSFVLNDKKCILNFSDEYHLPYGSYTRLLNLDRRFFMSFVAHHMIFNNATLKTIKKEIESYTGEHWITAILNVIDFNESSCFSEYELYGNYMYFNCRDKIHLEYWNNKTISSELLNQKVIDNSKGKFKSISFHSYQEKVLANK